MREILALAVFFLVVLAIFAEVRLGSNQSDTVCHRLGKLSVLESSRQTAPIRW